MSNVKISPQVLNKLVEKHGVQVEEVEQCFANRCGRMLEDNREDHKTDPPTQWFVAETNYGRELKIVFIFFKDECEVHIKTAYPANLEEKRIYKKYGLNQGLEE